MGGPGSGCRDHWWRPRRKTAVEECLILDLARWARKQVCVPDSQGIVQWTKPGRKSNSVRYQTFPLSGRMVLRLTYFAGEINVALNVILEATTLHRGGRRWWGRCPLAVAGWPCHRRVGKLYLPPGACYFGCRR